jgi:hypothetical protein
VRVRPAQEASERKRAARMEQEQARWERMAEQAAAEAARLAAVRATGMRGRQNKSSEHFDIITLNYADTPEGHTLQHKVRNALSLGGVPSMAAPAQACWTRAAAAAAAAAAPAHAHSARAPGPRPTPPPQDEVARYRSVLRSQFLLKMSHSVAHNIISGETRPSAATAPSVLQQPQEAAASGRSGGRAVVASHQHQN